MFSVAINMSAQQTLTLKGKVYDGRTGMELVGATVALMTPDSTTLATTTANKKWIRTIGNEDKSFYTADYEFQVPRQDASYIVAVSFLGYKTKYKNFSVEKLGKRQFEIDVPDIYVMPESKVLKEVTVTGSKVKFYNKGDTVVFNADAFILAEGSMLDALIRQMPGVELRPDGRILHNGKFVESLLLDGKEFFKGNNQLMLDVLPAYTVKNIKIYDKQSDESKFVGSNISGMTYVMDVRLKKEYNVGWMANLEAGGGSNERYLGRLFAMRNTDHSRVSVYGNINNLNDKRRPGEQGTWSPEQMPKGDNRERQGGIDYNINSRSKKFNLKGNATVAYSDMNSLTDADKVNFLASGDTYDYERSNNRYKNLSFKTQHTMDLETGKYLRLSVVPTLSYTKHDDTNSFLSGSFSTTQGEVTRSLLEKIFSGEDYRNDLLNIYRKQGIGKGHKLDGGISATTIIKIKGTNDNMRFITSVSGSDWKDETFNKYGIKYSDRSTPSTSGNQYYDNAPNKEMTASLNAIYVHRLTKFSELSFFYKFDRHYRKTTSSLYLLDRLDESDGLEVGQLPSASDYELAIDLSNSYKSRLYESTHQLQPFWAMKTPLKKGGVLFAQVRVPIRFLHQKLNYQRGVVDTVAVRNTTLIDAENIMLQWTSKDRSVKTNFHVEVNSKAPDILKTIDIRDDTDPMNIRLGNPDLKSSTYYFVEQGLTLNNFEKKSIQDISIYYEATANALAMGYTYNTKTGVRTYKPCNVNGNFNIGVGYDYERPIDKRRLLDLKTKTRIAYINNVDMIGSTTGDIVETERSKVHTTALGEKIELKRRFGKSQCGIMGELTWRNIDSRRVDFSRISAFDYKYGVNAILQLPWKLQLGTDLTVYGRRGYEGSMMNTDDVVWNARLSRPFMKGKITCMLDAFDILGDLSNITRAINAQGRTETWTNTLPRYVMFHVAWNMTTQKTKK